MSSHSLKARVRSKNVEREVFALEHLHVEICVETRTFAIFAGHPERQCAPRPLFSGVIQRGMGTTLRRIAHRFDDLEK